MFADRFGEWLSLVEHLVRDQGVGGSNPLSPTNFSVALGFCSFEKMSSRIFSWMELPSALATSDMPHIGHLKVNVSLRLRIARENHPNIR